MPRPILSGSPTGYIDNAIIGSQVRLRFDIASDNQAPDRAEFFDAKCGCYRELVRRSRRRRTGAAAERPQSQYRTNCSRIQKDTKIVKYKKNNFNVQLLPIFYCLYLPVISFYNYFLKIRIAPLRRYEN